MRRPVHGQHVFNGRIVLNFMRGRKMITPFFHHDGKRLAADLFNILRISVRKRTGGGNAAVKIEPPAEFFRKIPARDILGILWRILA